MNVPPFRIKAFGPQAVLLEWPARLDAETLSDLLGFTDYLKTRCLDSEHWEYIPIYHSLTLVNRVEQVDMNELGRNLKQWYGDYPGPVGFQPEEWELPVCYESDFGPDLEAVASRLNLSVDALIRAHTSRPFRVYGIGFLPGFLYLGDVPESLQVPRKESPRLKVAKGSVGLAGKQTGVYPQDSPGGWNIIGNCPIPLFDPKQDPPCLIGAGDLVRFRAVSRAEYDLHKIEADVGVYDFKKKYGNAKG